MVARKGIRLANSFYVTYGNNAMSAQIVGGVSITGDHCN